VLRNEDPATLRFYAETAETYIANGPGGASRRLAAFLELLPRGACILELGCGGGRDAEAMLAQGFEVEPTDGTPEIARQAEARLGRPVRVMRFGELEAIAAYDAVWANASLLHVPRESLPDVLGRIFRALKPGGVHGATYKGGGREGRDSHGRYFSYLSRDELLDVYERSAPWTVESVLEYVGGGYEGTHGPWVAITARRPA
jgi:SAM-dependent methyltransferase